MDDPTSNHPSPDQASSLLSFRSEAEESASAVASALPTQPQTPVILSEQRESKDPGTLSLAQPVQTLSTQNSSPPPPRAVKPAIRWLTYLLLFPLIAVATAAFGMVSLVAGLWDTSGKQQHAIASAWANVLLWIAFSPVTLIGKENLTPTESAVYASNHLSYYDTPVLFAKLPFQFRIIAKQSLWKVPFIGWYLNRSGQLPIDSKTGRSAIAGLLRGVKSLQSGMPLVLFPEGGRAADGTMTPFQSGAAFMALRAQVPLVPIALIGTYELLPIHTYHLTPRPLKIIIGKPLATTGLTTRDAEHLTAQLFQAIETLYAQHS